MGVTLRLVIFFAVVSMYVHVCRDAREVSDTEFHELDTDTPFVFLTKFWIGLFILSHITTWQLLCYLCYLLQIIKLHYSVVICYHCIC